MSGTEQRLGVYEFDTFRLDVVERSLWRRQRRIPLGGRAFDVLAALVRQAGRLITKEDLLQQAWKGRVVEEGNIHVQISTLRRLLGEKAISTVSGHGYRFELPIGTGSGSAARESNLPAALTPLVSREREINELSTLLSRQRLVTVKGMGGIGKSSVAAETCRRLQEANTALRCWHVPVGASEQGGDALQSTILHAVDRRPKAGKGIDESLVTTLREKPTLLMLDGCEMIADTAAHTVRKMLEQCPELKIVCTSRKSLGLVGESVFELPPLQLEGARKLFLERAASASRSFEPSQVDTKQLDKILRKLDGIPLAIELAASRLRAIGLKDLEQQLADRLGTLVANDRSLPSRQSTLRATLEWSYRLLSDEERSFLNRVSIFQAPFTAEAAAYVGIGPHAPVSQAIDLLTGLVDKSLVTPEVSQKRPLYGITEIVREYASEESSSARATDGVRDALARFIFKKTRDANRLRDSQSWEESKWNVLQLYPDLNSAIRHCIEKRDIKRAVELCHNVFLVSLDKGVLDDELRTVQPMLAQASKLPALPRAMLFHVAGGLSQDRGDFRTSVKHLAASSRLLVNLASNSALYGIVLNDLGVTYQYLGKRSEALKAYSKAQQIFRVKGLARREAVCLTNLAAMDCYLDRFDEAEEKLRRAQSIYRKTGDGRGLALCLSWLSECHLESNHPDKALALAREATDTYPPKESDLLSVSLLNRLAVAEAINGQPGEGRRTWLMSLAALGGRPNPRAQVDLLEGALSILIQCEQLNDAARVHFFLKDVTKASKELATPVRLRRTRAREKTLLRALGSLGGDGRQRVFAGQTMDEALELLRHEFSC